MISPSFQWHVDTVGCRGRSSGTSASLSARFVARNGGLCLIEMHYSQQHDNQGNMTVFHNSLGTLYSVSTRFKTLAVGTTCV